MHQLRQLEARISKKDCICIANQLLNNEQEMLLFLDLLKNKNTVILNNVFWILREIQSSRPELLNKNGDLVFKVMILNKAHKGIFRNGLALFKKINISTKIESEFYRVCFGLIQNHKSSIAIIAFSINVCYNIAQKHTDLLKELFLIIEDLILTRGQTSGAIGSTGKRTLSAINQRLHK
jgi:hypothetical protein